MIFAVAMFNGFMAAFNVYLYAEFGHNALNLFAAVFAGLCAVGLFILAAVN